MAIKTKADIHPITIHNFVVDNNILSFGLSSNGTELDTVNIQTLSLIILITVVKPIHIIKIYVRRMTFVTSQYRANFVFKILGWHGFGILATSSNRGAVMSK